MIRYFSIDEEFSGLNHRKNCLLSIGIIEIEEKDGIYIPNHSRKFYLELKPTKKANAFSMSINKLNYENLEQYGVTEINAVREIHKYLNLQKGDIAVFIAYCGVLDKIFMDQLFMNVEQKRSPFDYEILEISSLAIGKLGLKWGFTEKELLEKLNIEPLSPEDKHNALQDAILQAKEFCAIMNYKEEIK